MKNTNFLIIALIALTTSLSAQSGFGVKAIYSSDYTSPVTQEYVSIQPVQIAQIAFTGAEATRGLGLSFYTQNSKLFLMGDALYTKTGRSFELLSLDSRKTLLDPAVLLSTKESNIRLAANAGFLLNNFKFGVGPELSLRLDQEENLTSLSNVSSRATNIQGGFNFLVGYKLTNNIHIDLKHTYIFQDAGHDFTFDNIPLELGRNQKSLELSVGLYF